MDEFVAIDHGDRLCGYTVGKQLQYAILKRLPCRFLRTTTNRRGIEFQLTEAGDQNMKSRSVRLIDWPRGLRRIQN